MQKIELSAPERRLIGKLGIILLLAIVLLTFLSKTINNFLMPEVTTAQFVKGSLQESFEADGTVELSGKHKIFAGGSWKVEKVDVKVNQQIKKGDVLAVMDEKDIRIGLKTAEYELVKLENDLQSYKNSFKPIRLSDYERELQLAQRDLDEAKKHLDRTKGFFSEGIDSMEDLKDAENNYDDKSYLYQSKKEALEDKKKESISQQDEFNRTVNEKTTELELKKLIYEKESNYLTKDAKVLSDMDGLITAVDIEPGMETQSNQMMFEIVDIDCPFRVVWYLNEEKASSYTVGSKVSLEISGEVSGMSEKAIKTEIITTKIAGKEMDAGSGTCKFWADVDRVEDGVKISVSEGQKAVVRALLNSQVYDYLLPKNGVTQVQGKNYIYEVKKRQGALGIVDYVVETEVEILGKDNSNVAVKGFFRKDDIAVTSTTKPLSDGVQVHVR